MVSVFRSISLQTDSRNGGKLVLMHLTASITKLDSLMDLQHSFLTQKLSLRGRDMGTVDFPSPLKIFLDSDTAYTGQNV